MPLTIPIPPENSNASASTQTTEIPVITAAELVTESSPDPARAVSTRTGAIPGEAVLQTELLDRLIAEEVAPLTLFRAPTGYGKTAVISEWIAESGLTESEPRQVHWFSCGAGSSPRFLAELSESVANAFGVDAVRASEPVAALIRQIAAVDKPLTLVIDDYHHATSAENDLDLVALCQASPGLTLIVAGRRMQVLDGPLSRSRLHVRVIGPAELSHGTSAAHELAAHFGIPDDERLRTALGYAVGWPLAVRAALDSSEGHDPLTNLNRFALHHLEMLSRVERHALLSASQLDAITLDQIAEECEVEISEARPAVHRLLELGLLCRTLDVDSTDFRCHSSVQPFLAARAKRSSTAEQREALYRARAERIQRTAPFTAFRLYCAAEAYEDAEQLLARHFSMIIDEAQETGRIVRGLPEAVLVAHPTFMAARLMLTMADLSVPPSSITHQVEVWQHSLAGKTAQGSIADAVPAEMQLPYLAVPGQ